VTWGCSFQEPSSAAAPATEKLGNEKRAKVF